MVRTILSQSKNVWFKSSRECSFMINEEGIKKIIFVFKNSSKELKNTIENKQVLNHNEKELWNVLNIIKNNFDEIKKNENYKILLKEMYNYNTLLNEYNKISKNKLRTLGDYFRDIGLKTSKSSVFTRFNY